MDGTRYYGKYAGIVFSNLDPEGLGQITVSVSDVFGPGTAKPAKPCVPMASFGSGVLALPAPGSHVWVEFEQGDKDHPIWTGCYWGSAAELPSLAAPPPIPAITLQTIAGNGISICDALGPSGLGGIVLKSVTGASITVNSAGIVIDNGLGAKITLVGNVVDINNTALTVT